MTTIEYAGLTFTRRAGPPQYDAAIGGMLIVVRLARETWRAMASYPHRFSCIAVACGEGPTPEAALDAMRDDYRKAHDWLRGELLEDGAS
jgi:hypothetical protein